MVTYRTITPHTSPPHSSPPPGQYSPLQLLLVNSINLIFTTHLLCCDSSCDPIAPPLPPPLLTDGLSCRPCGLPYGPCPCLHHHHVHGHPCPGNTTYGDCCAPWNDSWTWTCDSIVLPCRDSNPFGLCGRPYPFVPPTLRWCPVSPSLPSTRPPCPWCGRCSGSGARGICDLIHDHPQNILTYGHFLGCCPPSAALPFWVPPFSKNINFSLFNYFIKGCLGISHFNQSSLSNN